MATDQKKIPSSALLDASEIDLLPRNREAFAAERALLMFGCYRKGEANDPEIYTAAVTAILAEYHPLVIKRVTDPRTGLPRSHKFMPNPAEVAEACDNALKAIKAEKQLKEMGWEWHDNKWQKRG